jgi:CRP/FNR family cyclic AMP-dependent transcriptional regulator
MLQLPTRLAKALLRLASVERGQPAVTSYCKSTCLNASSPQLRGEPREHQSINKYLGLWQRRGIVQVEERLITIADRTALEELAQAGIIRTTP